MSRMPITSIGTEDLAQRAARWAGAALLALGAAMAPAQGAAGWLDGARPSAQAQQAVRWLADAATHGLDPGDYGAPALQRAVLESARGAALPPDAAARLEAALTAAMQHYLSDLQLGRVDPRRLHQEFSPVRRDAPDMAARLREALATARLAELVRDATPQVPQYEALRGALARYRELADHAAWSEPLPPLPRVRKALPGKVEPGDAWPGLERLAQRLVALGDLAPGAAAAPVYEGPLVEALKSFQQRHGLQGDGVVGRATWAALQVGPAQRVRQIEWMLERLRWTPLLQGRRMIVINIPEFVLRAYEVHGGRIVVREQMKVIVGRALRTQTPLFDEDLRRIEFSPYWNVPVSIARHELVPRLQRDAASFEREGYEFVAADGSVGRALTPAALQEVLAGRARIRQRPGPANALGDIKFVFPNREHIFLHHTPSTRLFERERRDFSHGCIRVERPVALAMFALQGMPQWTEARVREAMGRRESSSLSLAEPVPVLIAYGTTLVKAGRIHFFDDLYGHDRALERALEQRRRPPLPQP